MILLNNMDTFLRALSHPLAMKIHNMQLIITLPTMERRVPEDEVEGEKKTCDGKDLAVTVAHTVVTAEAPVATSQG